MRITYVRRFGRVTLGALALALALGGCAGAPHDDIDEFGAEQVNDPLETMNRLVFAANVAVDTLILQPVAVTYRDLMWPPIKNNVHNLLLNMRLPLTFVNAILQGNFSHAERTASRFVSNMLLLWMGDVGADEQQVEDFGQTLATWGVEDGGPYIMLPLLGPSNVRDTVGLVFDFFVDPVNTLSSSEILLGRTVTGAVDSRSRNVDDIRDLQANSLDYYATVRSLYRQQRQAMIDNSTDGSNQPAPTISIDAFSSNDEEASK
ncbi:MAG: MlaA family lipoprotein [Alphaproteobacteria bacterium]